MAKSLAKSEVHVDDLHSGFAHRKAPNLRNEGGKAAPLSKNKRACVRCGVWCNAMNARVL